MSLARNIRLIRKKWKLSQEGFAHFFDLTRANISTYEQGANDPKMPFLVRLQELSGLSIYDLYTRELTEDEIPSSPPGYGNTISISPIGFSEPSAAYHSKAKSANQEELTNYIKLIEKVKEIEERVIRLEQEKD